MTAVVILVVAGAAAGLLVARARFNAWARSERKNGHETIWTKNIGTAAPSVAASRTAMLGTWLGVPIAIVLVVGGIALGGGVGTGLLIFAVAVVALVYVLRIRA